MRCYEFGSKSRKYGSTTCVHKFGFSIWRKAQNYYGEGEDALVMWVNLNE